MGEAGDRTAVIDGNRSFAYSELGERCMRLGSSLARFGLDKGDRVAILAKNCHQYLEAYVGIPAHGLVVVPLDTGRSMAEIEHLLEDSATRILLTDRDPAAFRGMVEHAIPFGPSYESLLGAALRLTIGEDVAEDDLAGLFYRDPSSGTAEAVRLTHGDLIASAESWLAAAPYSPADRFLLVAPMSDAAGSANILPAIWKASTQIPLPTFDPAKALDLVEEHAVTCVVALATQLAALAEEQAARPRRVDSLRWIAHESPESPSTPMETIAKSFPNAQLIPPDQQRAN
jgi:long-chain acyl-CoA synthetase